MYPANFFNYFPAFPKQNDVFVAMSFDEKFEKRWTDVIAPAVSRIEENGIPFKAIRVDGRRVGDSILTEILLGISNSRVIFADISTIGFIDGRPIRNSNVLYEVGISHAARQPEEIVMFRSDKDDLPFDLSSIRVNWYDPENDPGKAMDLVGMSILESIKETQLYKSLAVKSAANKLDFDSYMILLQAAASGTMDAPVIKTMGQYFSNSGRKDGISKLLSLGLMSISFSKITKESLDIPEDTPATNLIKYQITSFGRAVLEYIVREQGIYEIKEHLEEKLKDFTD